MDLETQRMLLLGRQAPPTDIQLRLNPRTHKSPHHAPVADIAYYVEKHAYLPPWPGEEGFPATSDPVPQQSTEDKENRRRAELEAFQARVRKRAAKVQRDLRMVRLETQQQLKAKHSFWLKGKQYARRVMDLQRRRCQAREEESSSSSDGSSSAEDDSANDEQGHQTNDAADAHDDVEAPDPHASAAAVPQQPSPGTSKEQAASSSLMGTSQAQIRRCSSGVEEPLAPPAHVAAAVQRWQQQQALYQGTMPAQVLLDTTDGNEHVQDRGGAVPAGHAVAPCTGPSGGNARRRQLPAEGLQSDSPRDAQLHPGLQLETADAGDAGVCSWQAPGAAASVPGPAYEGPGRPRPVLLQQERRVQGLCQKRARASLLRHRVIWGGSGGVSHRPEANLLREAVQPQASGGTQAGDGGVHGPRMPAPVDRQRDRCSQARPLLDMHSKQGAAEPSMATSPFPGSNAPMSPAAQDPGPARPCLEAAHDPFRAVVSSLPPPQLLGQGAPQATVSEAYALSARTDGLPAHITPHVASLGTVGTRHPAARAADAVLGRGFLDSQLPAPVKAGPLEEVVASSERTLSHCHAREDVQQAPPYPGAAPLGADASNASSRPPSRATLDRLAGGGTGIMAALHASTDRPHGSPVALPAARSPLPTEQSARAVARDGSAAYSTRPTGNGTDDHVAGSRSNDGGGQGSKVGLRQAGGQGTGVWAPHKAKPAMAKPGQLPSMTTVQVRRLGRQPDSLAHAQANCPERPARPRFTAAMQAHLQQKAKKLEVQLPALCACHNLSVLDPRYPTQCSKNCQFHDDPGLFHELVYRLLQQHGLLRQA